MRRLSLLVTVFLAPAAWADPLPKSLAPYFTPPAEFAGQFGDYRSPLRFADGTEVKTADDWKRRRQEILQSWHDLMGPQPEPIARPKLEILDERHVGNYTRHHVRVEVAPGKSTEDAYLLVPDGKGPFPAVLVVFYDGLTGIGEKGKMRDFALQLAKRGFVTLSLGSPPESYYPNKEACKLQPLSYHAYVASNCRRALANLPYVDGSRIGVVGHSYGGKWAMFASCLDDQFACAAWSDPGIVFDEKRSNVNYWEPWYLGFAGGPNRKPGIPTEANPRTGPYKRMMEKGMDLHELHALMAPRPFLVSGGSEDPPERWRALNHTVAVNRLLGFDHRAGMTNRPAHEPTPESNELLYHFFEHFLKEVR
jgi:Prolyl oligopeptidase family